MLEISREIDIVAVVWSKGDVVTGGGQERRVGAEDEEGAVHTLLHNDPPGHADYGHLPGSGHSDSPPDDSCDSLYDSLVTAYLTGPVTTREHRVLTMSTLLRWVGRNICDCLALCNSTQLPRTVAEFLMTVCLTS